MKPERYLNEEKEFRAFGFPNLWVSKSAIKRALAALPEIEIQRYSRQLGEETFLEFTYKGKLFFVLEPYGDNSYFDLVCDEPNTDQLEDLFRIFSSNGFMRKLVLSSALKVISFVILVAIIIYILVSQMSVFFGR